MTDSRPRIMRLTKFFAFATLLLPAAVKAGDNDRVARDGQQVREGTLMDGSDGNFEMTGDQVSFYLRQGNASMRCLENLALERIVQQLPGVGRERTWVVTGTITEYQGRNYLLVTRAVLKTRPAP